MLHDVEQFRPQVAAEVVLVDGSVELLPLNHCDQVVVDATPDGRVIGKTGKPSPVVSTLGTALKGILWESTAIPEIRTQARDLALRLLAEASLQHLAEGPDLEEIEPHRAASDFDDRRGRCVGLLITAVHRDLAGDPGHLLEGERVRRPSQKPQKCGENGESADRFARAGGQEGSLRAAAQANHRRGILGPRLRTRSLHFLRADDRGARSALDRTMP